MDSNKESTENLGALHGSSAVPEDFIAFKILWMSPRRYVKKGEDNWDVLRWSDRWTFFDNVGDQTATKEYVDATNIFVRHSR